MLLKCSMWAHTLRTQSPLMTAPELLWLGCARWFILKKGLHPSVCKHHITAAVHATSEQGTTASHLRFQCSVTQSRWFVPPCHHDDMHIHVLLYVQWHDRRYLQSQDYVAPPSYTCTEQLTFHSVTKVTSLRHSQPVKAMLKCTLKYR